MRYTIVYFDAVQQKKYEMWFKSKDAADRFVQRIKALHGGERYTVLSYTYEKNTDWRKPSP